MKVLYYATLLSSTIASAYNYGHHRPLRARDYDNRVYYAVELDQHTKPEEFLKSRGGDWEFEQQLGSLENHYLFSVHKSSDSASLVEGIRDRPVERVHHERRHQPSLQKRSEKLLYKRNMQDNGVVSLQVLEPKRLYKRAVDSQVVPLLEAMKDLDIKDPIFKDQWHLINPSEPGQDLNITGVWRQGITGKNAMAVAVVDDGLDYEHEDLKDSFFAPGSYDFNDQRENPRPELIDDQHGTRCAGEIAAVKNDVCGIGVAYDGKVAGVRILSGRISEGDEALALNYAMDKNAIYSCSWGPPDDGQAVAEPGMIVRKAIINGVQNGRDKKGSIFVFASGNGGMYGDNCNFDGYTNSIYSITVAAIDRMGYHPSYSEQCSANMVVTYSSGSNDHIHTTDFHGKCTDRHGGTSAAAPIAAGVFSLVLETRPELTWRDVQYLAMDTAVPVNEHEEGWQTTSIGKKYHHKYGYGKIDAYAIVERAKEWPLVKPQAWHFHDSQKLNQALGYGEDKCVISTVEVTEKELKDSNMDRLEHVNVFLNIDHDRRGVLTANLTSPDGVTSQLLRPRYQDDSRDGLVGWTVMSVAHWGEKGVGNWTFKVCNNEQEHQHLNGRVKDWRLKLWGEAKDAKKAMLFPIPKEQDPDPDHRESGSPNVTPTEYAVPKPTTKSHHDHSSVKPSTSAVPSSSTPKEATSAKPTAASTSSQTWTMIPTFGLSTHTLAWIYGSVLLILGFVGCITTYICVKRRKSQQGVYKAARTSSPSMELRERLAPHIDSEDEDDSYLDLHESDIETYASPQESVTSGERITAGKKARILYDSSALQDSSSKEVFKVDDEDDDDDGDQESKPLNK